MVSILAAFACDLHCFSRGCPDPLLLACLSLLSPITRGLVAAAGFQDSLQQVDMQLQLLYAGVDSKRTEQARCGLLIVVCQALVNLGVTHSQAVDSLMGDEQVQ